VIHLAIPPCHGLLDVRRIEIVFWPLWGDANVVRERLGTAVEDVVFDRDRMLVPALSVCALSHDFRTDCRAGYQVR